MFLAIIVGLISLMVGTGIGAYSHKWLASQVQSATGIDPNVKLQSPFATQPAAKPVVAAPPKV